MTCQSRASTSKPLVRVSGAVLQCSARLTTLDADRGELLEEVFRKAKVKYAVMTNNPFDDTEAGHWQRQTGDLPKRLRAALRVDPLLVGHWPQVSRCLRRDGFQPTLEGVKAFLRHWAALMSPVYLMASVPHDFEYRGCDSAGTASDAASSQSVPPTAAQLLTHGLIAIARELNLAVALKVWSLV